MQEGYPFSAKIPGASSTYFITAAELLPLQEMLLSKATWLMGYL